MAWKGIAYGNLDEVRAVVLDWGECHQYLEHVFSFESHDLYTSDREEGLPGVEIQIDIRVNPTQIRELLGRLESRLGGRPYLWPLN